MAEPAARAVVSDDGSTIWLTAYTAAGQAVPVAIEPVRAVALAGELIRAALPKLGVVEKNSIVSAPKRRRGGDPFAKQRGELHHGLRALAHFRKQPGKPLADVAEEIIEQQQRYQPMAKETDPERLEMLRVRNTGLRVPGVRQVVSIISE